MSAFPFRRHVSAMPSGGALRRLLLIVAATSAHALVGRVPMRPAACPPPRPRLVAAPRRAVARAVPLGARPLMRADDDEGAEVPEAVLAAVERSGARSGGSGARVTDADVAVLAGLPIEEARRGLIALARMTGAELEVSPVGDIEYGFPANVRGALQRESAIARRRATWLAWRPRLATAARTAYGVGLFASLALATLAITVLAASGASSSSSDSDRNSGGYSSRQVSYSYVNAFPSPFDIWYYSRPRPYLYYGAAAEEREGRRGRGRGADGARPLNFFEACYSLVFGDGDPNVELDERRWRLVAALIRENRGVLTAEQLAPFLEPPREPLADGTADGVRVGDGGVDESWVLPALERFGGVPQVVADSAGTARIVYTFPELSTSARGAAGSQEALLPADRSLVRASARGLPDGYLAEQPVPFSRAEPAQLVQAGLLSAANLAAILTLGRYLRAARAAGTLATTASASGAVAAASALYAPLLLYAAVSAGAPLLRNLVRRRANAAREARNALRAQWAQTISRGRRSPELERKLLAARRTKPEPPGRGARRADAEPLYSTRRSAFEEGGGAGDVLRSFDERLAARERAGGKQGRGGSASQAWRDDGDDDIIDVRPL